MASDAAVEEMVRMAPFSLVVSDASVDFHEVLTKVVGCLAKADGVLKRRGEGGGSHDGGGKAVSLLSTPSVIVITLKLPHKSKTSLDRNLKKVLDALPKEIEKMMEWVTPQPPLSPKGTEGDNKEHKITVDCKILHLMANTASERTCIIRFRHIH